MGIALSGVAAFDNELSPAHLVPSPTASAVAVVSKTKTNFYALSEDGSTWHGPYEVAYGYQGAPDNAQRPKEWPPYTWTTTSDGTELFFPRASDSVACAVVGEEATLIEATAQAVLPLIETHTGRLQQMVYSDEQSHSIEEILDKAHYFDGARTGFTSREAVRGQHLPNSLYMLSDVSPTGDRILCRPTMEDPIVGMDLRTGQMTTYKLHEHPRVFPDYMSARYSPDGHYVLMTFSYDYDDHYVGSHIQVFTTDGKFYREIVAFGERLLGVQWLHNGWIVYAINDQLIFTKFAS